jgi:hypothetical protein
VSLRLIDVDKSHCVTTEQKLLWNIQELLKDRVPIDVPQPKVEVVVDQPKDTCTYCGGTHENRGQVLACAKKFKKGSVSK